MKIVVKDGKGRRVVTEFRRPDPAAVLIVDEEVEVDVTNAELNLLVTLGYFRLENVVIDGSVATAVYPDAIVYAPAQETVVEETAGLFAAQETVVEETADLLVTVEDAPPTGEDEAPAETETEGE